MASSTSNLDLISSSQASKEVTANALFDASSVSTLFGRRASTTAALTWGYYGGVVVVGNTPTAVANGTLALTASLVNYIEYNPGSGALVTNTSGWSAASLGYARVYAVTCGASTITSYVDWRFQGIGAPIAQYPMVYISTWNASTNTPTLAAGTGTKGYFYKVSTGGTQDLGNGSTVFTANDSVVYNGATWDIIQGGITSAEINAAYGFTLSGTASKTYTLPTVDATMVYSGGALGTPTSGVTDNLTTTTTATAIVDTDFVDTNLAAGGKRKILWTAVKTYLNTTFAALAGSASQAFSASTLNVAAGTVSAPSLTLSTDTTTGLYRIGANNDGYAVSGAKVLDIGSTGLAVTGTLSASGPVLIGTGIAQIGGAPYSGELGFKNSTAIRWVNGAGTAFLGAIFVDASNNLMLGGSGATANTVISVAGVGTVGTFSSTGLAVTGQVSPSAHNTYDLGTTGVRWKDLWLQSGAFNGSDERLKTAIAPLTANEINAAKQLSKEIGTYQWLESVQKKGDAARHHVGFTVQRAIEILQANGCDPFSYGFIGYDKWDDVFVEHAEVLPVASVEAKDAVLDADGNELEPAVAAVEAVEGKAAWTEHKTVAGDAYSFRYDQLNMFVAAGLEARLAALEAK